MERGRSLRAWDEAGTGIDLTLIGSKANSFFKRMGGNIVSTATHLGDKPSIIELIGTVKVMLDAYEAGDIDRLYLVHNTFVNTMTQEPEISQLIPVAGEEDEQLKVHWDYIYEPDSRPVMDALMIRYIESLVYQGVVENVACEMAARMVAMKSATDNAGNLIDELQLIYNKARQAAITRRFPRSAAAPRRCRFIVGADRWPLPASCLTRHTYIHVHRAMQEGRWMRHRFATLLH